MQQLDNETYPQQSISNDTIQASHSISNESETIGSSADERSNRATNPLMSWHSESASAYHQTIGHKIPAYPVLYELSGMILETGMNRQPAHLANTATEHNTNQPTRGNRNASMDESINSSIHSAKSEANSLLAHKQAALPAPFQPLRHVAVIGAGGGQELVAWLPHYPHWLVTGVDPSVQMLNLAKQRTEQADLATRCRLHIGTIDQLPERVDPTWEGDGLSFEATPTAAIPPCNSKSDSNYDLPNSQFAVKSQKNAAPLRYDAAACLLVLHFLPYEQQQDLLNQLVATVELGAPVIVASLSATTHSSVNDWQMQAWHKHMRQNGIAETDWQRFADSFGVTSHPPHVEKMEAMLAQAGLVEIGTYFQTLSIRAWCGRRAMEGDNIE
ncbi:class I SAM-dependent methyltransferase [Paenibacillus wenxiniae]|uniref:Class I SAM-dependent methyltransferase n=1 Tax=Paenibacillus wenxiniae TaxID=1636843 RepID=A0ABW4RE12_9BACL